MTGSTTEAPRLDWGDANAMREWARDVLTQARDALGAGEDATRAPGERELGRRVARRIITEVGDKIAALASEAGLDAGAP